MNWIQDVRYAFRVLAKVPSFSLLAILTLALGIGVNTLMFSLVDAVLFRPLPVDKPEQVVRIEMTNQSVTSFGGISFPALQDFRQQADAFTGLAAFSSDNTANLNIAGGEAERISATNVTGDFFEVLGLRPAAGRLFTAEDDVTPGGHPVMVLSESYWRRRFGGDRGVVGSTVQLNTLAFTVIGVAPRGFHGLTLGTVPDVFVPVTMIDQVVPNLAQFKPLERRGFTWLDVVGRLKPGASIQQANEQLNVIRARVVADLKLKVADDRYQRVNAMPAREALLAMGDGEEASRTSWMLIGVASLVLLIACAVVAGLLLVRGEQRQREVAVRFAVGASRGRIIRQLLVESSLLTFAGSALGILLAGWGTSFVQAIVPAQFPLPLGAATPLLAPRALLFTTGLAIFSTLVFGLIPAWRASQSNLMGAMKQDAALTTQGHRWFSLRNTFVVTQVALSVVLLAGAGLLLRTLQEASRVNVGFPVENGLVVSVDVSKSGYNRERGRQFYAQLLEQVRELPGVRDAAISRHVPLQGIAMMTSVQLTNFTPSGGEDPRIAFTSVSPGFFRTLGIPIERGRDFGPADGSETDQVIIVNRAFADQFWPGRDPLGERVLNFGAKGAQVIAVVADTKQSSVRESGMPMLYVPFAAFYTPNTNLLVRTHGDSRSVLPSVTTTIHALDRNVPVFRSRTLAEHVGAALSNERMLATLLTTFAGFALALAAVGLYGVISYTTQIRTREFGIRLALGALPGDLLGLVLRQGVLLAVAGLAVGLLAAVFASRILASILFGVSQTDALTFGLISCLLLLVAAIASAVPARRATRVSPVRALRYE